MPALQPDIPYKLIIYNTITTTMPTTIQVQDDVYEMLEALKNELRAESYSDVIRHLLRKSKCMDESGFGSMPGIAPLQREEIDRFDFIEPGWSSSREPRLERRSKPT